jgi:xanthine dehydrogenase accessory factor
VKATQSAIDAARAVSATNEGGPAVAVVTIVAGQGAGRRLLVHEPASTTGTLGSAALDAAAHDLGLRALAARDTLLETFPLDTAAAQPSTQPSDASQPASPGADAGSAAITAPGTITLYAEAHHPPEELVIVGAGHIAVPLAELGVQLGYRVVVLDDREEFATADRFPAAASVLRTDFANPFHAVRIGNHSHVVLVTRAHRYDYDCLLHLLEGDAAPRYIGMIGSRRRVRATFLALLEAGIPRERIALVRAPVGIEIGAETPAEIAVSVAAELIMLRRGVVIAEPIADRERVLDRLLPHEDSIGTQPPPPNAGASRSETDSVTDSVPDSVPAPTPNHAREPGLTIHPTQEDPNG